MKEFLLAALNLTTGDITNCINVISGRTAAQVTEDQAGVDNAQKNVKAEDKIPDLDEEVNVPSDYADDEKNFFQSMGAISLDILKVAYTWYCNWKSKLFDLVVKTFKAAWNVLPWTNRRLRHNRRLFVQKRKGIWKWMNPFYVMKKEWDALSLVFDSFKSETFKFAKNSLKVVSNGVEKLKNAQEVFSKVLTFPWDYIKKSYVTAVRENPELLPYVWSVMRCTATVGKKAALLSSYAETFALFAAGGAPGVAAAIDNLFCAAKGLITETWPLLKDIWATRDTKDAVWYGKLGKFFGQLFIAMGTGNLGRRRRRN